MKYAKKALIREEGYPIGVKAPMYLNCECGHKLDIPMIAGMSCMRYECVCGIVYDQQGWVLARPNERGN